jgi:hypothetical protein
MQGLWNECFGGTSSEWGQCTLQQLEPIKCFAVMENALYYTALVQGSVLNGQFIQIAVT